MKQQLYFYVGMALLLPLFPVLYVQGKRVRRTVPQLPEAAQNVECTIPGALPAIRLLALGESTIAGVGVADHRDGIAGQLAVALRRATGQAVRWQVLARSGYTAERVRVKLVPKVPAAPLDFILIGLGGNDTFTLRSPNSFRRSMMGILESLTASHSGAKIIVANMPPVGQFPAFPQFMQRVLGWLVGLHGAVIRDVPEAFTHVYYLDQAIRFEDWLTRPNAPARAADFFSDGVHPSAQTYSMWAQEISNFMETRGILETINAA